MFRSFPALLVALGLALCPAPGFPASQPDDLALNLQSEGDRWFARGQYRTAFRLYQAAARSLGENGLPPSTTCRFGIAAVSLGEHRIGTELLKKALLAPRVPDCDPDLVRLYLALSLAREDKRGEALAALGGEIETLDAEEPGIQIGAIIAGKLADSGDARAALGMLEGLYRGAGKESGRRAVMARAREILAPMKAADIAAAIEEGRLSLAEGGMVLPWLEGLLASGAAARAQETAEAIGRLPGAGRAAELGRRAASWREEHEIAIGVLLPLSGNYRFFGDRILLSFQLALEEYPAPGVTLLVRDTAGDPETALRLARELIEQGKAKAILGPIMSNEVEKVVPLAAERKVALFSPAAQAAGLRGISPWFFRNCLTLQQQARTLARIAVKTLGMTRFAILSPGDNYGKTLSSSFWDEVTALGGRVLTSAQYTLDQTDFLKQISHIRGEEEVSVDEGEVEEDNFIPPFEAVYIPDTYDRVGLIAPQLSFQDIERHEVVLLGSNGLNSADFVRIGEEYAEGFIFVDAFLANRDDPRVKRFVERYRERRGEIPDVLAAQAYDAASIIYSLVRGGRKEPEDIRAGLAGLRDFPGVCGLTGMDEGGECLREPFLITVLKGHLVELEAAR